MDILKGLLKRPSDQTLDEDEEVDDGNDDSPQEEDIEFMFNKRRSAPASSSLEECKT